MADNDATGLQMREEFVTLTALDVDTTDYEWREDHFASISSPVAVLLLRRPVAQLATSSELRCDRRRLEEKVVATKVSAPTTVAVAQELLTPWPAPPLRNPFAEGGASS